ncbi:MAG: dienelactone hydrolase family protein [Chloroflexi bacterium]|nr:dienelactone hydrolase family protein [Chloroflexota bacterium]
MAQDLSTSTISFESDGESVAGYLARPSSGGPHPGLIVLQEWWGLDGHIKDLTDRFAREGYAALAVDMYSFAGNKVTLDADEAAKLMESLRHDTAMSYLNAGVDYLASADFARGDRIGVVGFCMGGGHSLLMSCLNKEIKAAVAFYGLIVNDQPTENNPVNPIDLVPQMSCPLLFVHAGLDEWITLDHADRLRDAMKRSNKEGEVKSYPNAPHAFFNDTKPDIYRQEEAQDAWRRTLAFLRRHLGG